MKSDAEDANSVFDLLCAVCAEFTLTL